MRHLTEPDIEALGCELDAIRRDIEESRGERDAVYIRRTILFQRTLEAVARLVIGVSGSRFGWLMGTSALTVAKVVENMEIGHNVCHGQWDWMNNPEIHSNTWEWDMAGLSSQWKYSHNFRHHKFTNVLGMDEDIGFGVMRVTRDVPWHPRHLAGPFRNLLLAIIFEWGIALHGIHSEHKRAATEAEKAFQTKAFRTKIKHQITKDYLVFPGAEPISLAPYSGRECRGERRTEPMGLRGDLLRALSRRRREIQCRGRRAGEPVRVVPAPTARQRELPRRNRARVPQRQPVLPD